MTGRLLVAIVTTVIQEAALAAIVLWGLPGLDIHVPLGVLIAMMAAWAANAVFFYRIGSRALRRQPVSGLGAVVGEKAKVIGALSPDGIVKIHDELWEATSASGEIEPGEEVIVVEQDGLKLVVVRAVIPEGTE